MSAQRSARSALSHGAPRSVSAEPPDVLELARGLLVVTALLVRERSCRVGDRAVGRLVEVCLGDQPGRFDRPSLRVSPIVHFCGREGQIAETEDPRVGELGLVAGQSECLPQHRDRLLRPAQENVRHSHSATAAEKPSGARLLLGRVDELSIAQHLRDAVRSQGSPDVRESRAKRRCPVGGCHVERPPLGRSDEPPRPGRIAKIPEDPRGRDRQLRV